MGGAVGGVCAAGAAAWEVEGSWCQIRAGGESGCYRVEGASSGLSLSLSVKKDSSVQSEEGLRRGGSGSGCAKRGLLEELCWLREPAREQGWPESHL